MSDVKSALVDKLPTCDMPNCDEPAEYDAKTRMGWGNLCQLHFDSNGCSLGLGKGQKLVLRGSAEHPAEVISKADALCRRCGKECVEECWNKETGRHRILDNPEKIEVMIMMGLYCEEI